jgi:hypothetical protein
MVASRNPWRAGSAAIALSEETEPLDHDAAMAKSAKMKIKSISLSFYEG